MRDCTSLGEIEATSGYGNLTVAAGYESNKRQLRTETAKLGGDTVLILQERTSFFMPTATFGEAYRCASNMAPATPESPAEEEVMTIREE